MIDLEAIKARALAATPGPWGVWKDHAEVWCGILKNTPGEISARRGCGPLGSFEDNDFEPSEDDDFAESTQAVANAEFTAAARTDVPALVAEVERLRGAVSRALALYESGDADGTGGAGEILRAALGETP